MRRKPFSPGRQNRRSCFVTSLFLLFFLILAGALVLAKQNLAEIHAAIGGGVEPETGQVLLGHLDETVLVHIGKGGRRGRRVNLLRRCLILRFFVLSFVLALLIVLFGFSLLLSRLLRCLFGGFFSCLFVVLSG